MADNCKHVAKIKPGIQLGILSPERWHCNVCNTTESVWACLSCNNVACGRYIAEHSLQHFKATSHPLCIEVNEKFVYICDDFVLNDNAPGDIKLLRMALDAVADQDFDELSKRKRGKRILRSYVGEAQKKSQRLLRADDIHTALVKNSIFAECLAYRGLLDIGTRNFLEKGSNIILNEPSDGETSLKRKRPFNLHPGFTGLRNLGNTCYMNSALQVLSHTAAFVNFVISHEPSEVVSLTKKRKRCSHSALKCFEVVDCPAKRAAVNAYLSDRSNNTLIDVHSSNEQGSISSENISQNGTTGINASNLPLEPISNSRIPSTCITSSKRPPFESASTGGLNGGFSNSLQTEGTPSLINSSLTNVMNPGSLNHSLYEELHSLFRVIWSGQRVVVSPHSLLYAIWMSLPAFKGYRQQDAQEFLSVFLDRLQMELHDGQLNWSSNQHDFVTRTFQGYLVSHIRCAVCSHSACTEEPFFELSLALLPAGQTGEIKECNLRDLLTQFTSDTPIDGRSYACRVCNSRFSKEASQHNDSVKGPGQDSGTFKKHNSQVQETSSSTLFKTSLDSNFFEESRPQDSANKLAAASDFSHFKESTEQCSSTLYTPASQTIRITRLPKVLRLHIKRFRPCAY
ncbi:unnamed protein product [Protopolystoma xenopodis]|uniref:ubiquitinyl hydrolase 1 n=1 Tax=Protopolystoma xenopodis TaxID=117903 RepID=A0A3S5CK57_9PLAT|nr:unnamed protein product [Protopolystoma xenopodis]